LEDFKPPEQPQQSLDDEIFSVRHHIKSWFQAQNLMCSVQGESYQSRLWLTISFTKKTKDRQKDKARLQRSKYFYTVHFPGEPYFYFAGTRVPEEVGAAIADYFGSSRHTAVPLSGHHLESLRQLRLNREGRKDSLAQQPTRDRFSVFNQAVSSQQEQPKLERLTTECNFEFKGQDMLESEDLMAGKKLKLSLECRGTDIIGGVNDLVTAEVIDQGQRWVSSLSTAGKNKLTLLARENEWEVQSVFSSASNTINFTRPTTAAT